MLFTLTLCRDGVGVGDGDGGGGGDNSCRGTGNISRQGSLTLIHLYWFVSRQVSLPCWIPRLVIAQPVG
jgi:hypothetical protein